MKYWLIDFIPWIQVSWILSFGVGVVVAMELQHWRLRRAVAASDKVDAQGREILGEMRQQRAALAKLVDRLERRSGYRASRRVGLRYARRHARILRATLSDHPQAAQN